MADEYNRIMTLPALALRGVAVFPGNVLNFDVERPMSIAALNSAISSDRLLFLVVQKQMEIDKPAQSDLYTVGVICRLSQILRVPGGNTVRAVVEGVHRAKLLRITSDTPCLWANVQIAGDTECDIKSPEATALIRHCIDLFSNYANLSPILTTETVIKVLNKDDPAFVSNYIAQNIFFKAEDKQRLLEERDCIERLRLLSDLLSKEIEIISIEKNISDSTSERMGKQQRDYYLREQMHVIREELGEEGDDDEIAEYRQKIKALHLTEENEAKLLKEVDHLAKQPFGSAESAVIRSYLDTCLEMPWNTRTEEVLDISLAQKMLDEDHYGLEKVKKRIVEYLAVRQLSSKVRGGVLCLVGPPGVGKTSIAMSVARATNRKMARISLGGIHDEAEIRGHRKTYVGAMPGRIVAGIQQAGSMNPLLVLDEIDKLGSDYRGDPSAALLEALDGEQNHAFRDHFLEIPIDLSETLFITTANSTDTIPRALLDRMEVIEIGSYTAEEKLQIAKNYLIPKQRKIHGLNGNQLRFSDDAIRNIISSYTRESGVRRLEQQIAAACRKAAMGIAGRTFRTLRIKPEMLPEILGPYRFKPDDISKTNTIGLVHGLAWTSVGGEVLDVECAVVPGTGKLELTGNLGSVMQESCKAAITYIRSRAKVLSIDPDFYKNCDIHIHFPESAVPKDGPSAGAAICLCVTSALSGIPVRNDFAMTGEVTIRGRILPIGGLREKSMAALRAGLLEVLIPENNLQDLEEVDEGVKSRVRFIPVSSMDQVLDYALVRAIGEDKIDTPVINPPKSQNLNGIAVC